MKTANEFKQDMLETFKKERIEIRNELIEWEKYVNENVVEIKELNDLRIRVRDKYDDLRIRFQNRTGLKNLITTFPDKSIFVDEIGEEMRELRDRIFSLDEKTVRWENITVDEIYKYSWFISRY